MDKRISKAKYNHIKNFKYSFRWLAYILGVITYILAMFHRVNTAVLAPYILEMFQVSSSSLGFMSGIYFYVYSLSQPIVGLLVDKLKPKKVLTLSVIIISLGTFFFAYAPSIIFIYLGRFLIGAGCAGIFIPVNWIINKYFAFEKRGFLLFIIQIVGNLGSILAAGPLSDLMNLLGWKNTLRSIGFISIAIGFLIWVTVRDSNNNYKEGHVEHTKDSAKEKVSWFSIIKNVFGVPIIKYCIVSTISMAAMLSFQSLWVIPYLIDVYQVNKSYASSLATLIPTGFVIGLLLFSKLSDTLYGKYIYFYSNIIIIFVHFFLIIFTENLPFYFLPFLLFIIGFTRSTGPYVYKIYTLVLPKRNFGTALGILNMSPFMAAAIYQSITGILFDILNEPDVLYQSVFSYRVYFLLQTIIVIISTWSIFKMLVILRKDYALKI